VCCATVVLQLGSQDVTQPGIAAVLCCAVLCCAVLCCAVLLLVLLLLLVLMVLLLLLHGFHTILHRPLDIVLLPFDFVHPPPLTSCTSTTHVLLGALDGTFPVFDLMFALNTVYMLMYLEYRTR
jgi:hypothetical protein